MHRAVTSWVFMQVLLVFFFSEVEGLHVGHLGGDGWVPVGSEFGAIGVDKRAYLLRLVGADKRPVLRADVIALAISLRWVVSFQGGAHDVL